MDDLLNIALSNAIAATVLALVAIAVGTICRRPALVHGLWLLVLLKLVTPPLLRIPIAWPSAAEPENAITATTEEPTEIVAAPPSNSQPDEPAMALAPAAVAEEEPIAPMEARPLASPPSAKDPPLWPRALRLAWIAGSLGWFVLALMRLARFGRLLRFARCAPPALQDRTQRLARRLGLKHCPRVGLLPGRLAPMLWSIGGSPRLLLPADLLAVLGDAGLDTLLMHELAHLRRRDHWVRALEFMVLGLYWWHPVVWYARRELREAEEQCCDAWVVSTLPGAGRTYATALMDTLDFLATARSAVPPLASGLGQVSDLKRRLTMIMRGTTPRALSWPGCLIVLAVAAFFLPLLPALQAQTPPRPEEKENKEIVLRLEGQIAQVEVGQSQADLKQLEADLQQKMAAVAAAKARLKAATEKARAQRERDKAKTEEKIRGRIEKAPEANNAAKPMIRIEIVVPADSKHTDVKELLRKIESVLPEAKILLTSKVYPGTVALPEPHSYGTRIQIGNDGRLLKVVPPLPTPRAGDVAAPQDKRISDLEKKLEKVLRELHDLRKEMGHPRGGAGNAPPTAPLPAIPTPPALTPAVPPPPAPTPAVAPPGP